MKEMDRGSGQCSTWNIFLRERLLVPTDRPDSPFLVTRHTVNGHLAGQAGAVRLRIVQLADLHLHTDYPPEKLRRLAALVNTQQPDLIVFTGDFLRHSGMHPLPPDALAILRGMKARYGKFAVRGNHDLRGNPRQVPYYLKKAGFRLLCNERASIRLPGGEDHPALLGRGLLAKAGRTPGRILGEGGEDPPIIAGWRTPGRTLGESGEDPPAIAGGRTLAEGGQRLVIAGLDDGAYHLADPRTVLALRRERGFRLVLAHEPMLARLVPPGAAELVLAGHTHAGQFRFAGTQRLWMPSLTGGNFHGWRAVRGNPLYVSAGLGESGLGLRILCPAELPVFDCWVG